MIIIALVINMVKKTAYCYKKIDLQAHMHTICIICSW